MSEQDLLAAYRKRLEFYQKKFDRDRVYPFTEIKFKDGGPKKISVKFFLNLFENDSILIPLKYGEIYNEIIDFAAIISFLPPEFRFDYMFRLIFLVQFQNSEIKSIKSLWEKLNKYLSDTMNRLVFTDFFLHFFLKTISLRDLLFEFTAGISPIYVDDVFFAVLMNWLRIIYSKKINIGTIRDFLSIHSNLHSFDDFVKAIKETQENYSVTPILLMRDYSKIGLDLFFVCIKFTDNKKSQGYLEKFFFQIPFFSNFLYSGDLCNFSCYIPMNLKSSLVDYLNRLRGLKIIGAFFVVFNSNSYFRIKFDNSLTRDQNIYELIPFTSKKFRNLPRNTKKYPNIAVVEHSRNYKKPIYQINPDFTILDFFIFFNIEKILSENFTPHNLLNQNSLVPSLRNLNSVQIKKVYDILIVDNIIPVKNGISFKNLINKIKEKYPKNKSIDILKTLFRALKIPDTSYLTKDFFDIYTLKIGNEFNRYLSKRSDHSIREIKIQFDLLFNKGYLKKYFNITNFLLMNPNTIHLTFLTKSPSEFLKNIFFLGTWTCENSSNREFTLTSDVYSLFSKYLLQENLFFIGTPYLFNSSSIGFDVVSFFDFEKRCWDEKKISDYLKSFLPRNSNDINHRPKKINISNWQDKLPVFRSDDFLKNLSYFNKLNKINKNSNLNREKIIYFFKNYIQTQQFDFVSIINQFNFDVKMEKFPGSEKQKRIFIIISQSGTNISPFILKKTRAFSILFSDSLQNGWYYGGSMDNILILEYLVGNVDLNNEESEWNVGIKKIKTKYPSLNLRIFELKEDLRFFSEQSLFSQSWYYDDYNYLKQSINAEFDDLEVKNEISFVFDSQSKYKQYHPHFLPWEFWQIIGYPVSVSVIVECKQKESKFVKKLLTRLPAGQIFTFKKDKKTNNVFLLAIVQMKCQIDRFFENIIPALNDVDCKYSVSQIISLSLYANEFIP